MKPLFVMPPALALGLFQAVGQAQLFACREDGAPFVRTVHPIPWGDTIAFHGGKSAAKRGLLGRTVCLLVQRIVAEIPSYFVDPERACPATTYYEGAELTGVMRSVVDPDEKLRILEALMARYQPEGGYEPMNASDPLYASAIKGVWVVRLDAPRVVGKRKLGQNRSAEQILHIVENLWRRGAPIDLAAVHTVLAAHPDKPWPRFLTGPAGTTLSCAPTREDAALVAELLHGRYWTHGVVPEDLARAQLNSNAWVVARDTAGAVIGSARATGDAVTRSYVQDVVVADSWQGQGVGTALMRLLLDHPAVRGAHVVALKTTDAAAFYTPLGFVPVDGKPGNGIELKRIRESGRPGIS